MTEQERSTFISVGDILKQAESAHRACKRRYERKPAAGGPRVEFLLDYAARKEDELLFMIETYRNEAPAHVLETHYQFTPEAAAELEEIRIWQPQPAESMEDALDTVLKFDTLFSAYYRRTAAMAPSEAVRDMFTNLADAVEQKKREQTLNADGVRDL